MDKNLHYGAIYEEVVRGYSRNFVLDRECYFKHPTQVEYFSIYRSYDTICEEAKSRGLLSEEEQLKAAIEGGWWSQEKEDKISAIRGVISRLLKTKSQLLYPSQKKQIDDQILSNERILITYTKERNSVVGYTAERYANEKLYDDMIFNLTFKNQQLTDRLFADESEYYYLSDDLVEAVRSAFISSSALFDTNTLKLVAASGFFQNLLFISDTNPFDFWGKPVTMCSRYQLDLLMYGKMIKNLIKYHAESDNKIDEDILNDPERLIKILDGNSVQKNRSTSSKTGSENNKVVSFVGATKEDLKDMGVKVEKIRGKSLLQMAQENGGVLEKSQYMNVRENL